MKACNKRSPPLITIDVIYTNIKQHQKWMPKNFLLITFINIYLLYNNWKNL